MKARPAGLSRDVGIMLPGNGSQTNMVAPGTFGLGSSRQVVGSRGTGPVKGPVKIPCFSKAVGTLAESTCPRSSRRHSSDQKKNTLFFTIGPLKLPPKLLYLSSPFGSPARFRKKLLALSESLR